MQVHTRHSYHLIQVCEQRSRSITIASCNDLIEQVRVVYPVYAPVEPILLRLAWQVPSHPAHVHAVIQAC
jgi:REP element-mobilizing transposase RayT